MEKIKLAELTIDDTFIFTSGRPYFTRPRNILCKKIGYYQEGKVVIAPLNHHENISTGFEPLFWKRENLYTGARVVHDRISKIIDSYEGKDIFPYYYCIGDEAEVGLRNSLFKDEQYLFPNIKEL